MDAVSLDEIIRSELEAFPSQTTIEGTEIFLDYQQAQKFSLAVHELTTNALKYGALSAPTGGVRITWSVFNDGKPLEGQRRYNAHIADRRPEYARHERPRFGFIAARSQG